MNHKTEHAILLALEALLKGKRDNGSKAALEAVRKALENGGYRTAIDPDPRGNW